MLGVKDIHGARTMGPPSGAELVSPTKRLAPHEKEPRLPPPAKPSPKERRKAPLDQTAPPLEHHPRDFISTNVQEAAAAAPKYQEQEEVRYVFKEHYGELPPYLRQRKAELEAARAAAQRSQQAQEEEEPGTRVISGDELAELIRHLKLKWQDINQAYVRLPCVLDTPSKRRRKEELEAQLGEIERDVRMLSKASSVRISSE
ncbi:hypothetical protein COHA_007752 [Chlorella ohadii]|uniref:Enkurin domain-containing protein n=1 Tax=Chlorella ohadii TaxID=2649997 RepID=A0AAD5H354_9CHLO|nr:hypothetical protein COHA_007752 [Chlorella ohadii]